MSRFMPDDSFDSLLATSMQARPLPAINPLLAEHLLARARQAELLAAARLRRMRWAQQAATLLAASLLLAIALIGGAQLLVNSSMTADSSVVETSLTAAEDAAVSLSSSTTQVAASFGLGLALLVTLLIGMHSALSPGGWSASQARLRW
jgi:hypothetical protein